MTTKDKTQIFSSKDLKKRYFLTEKEKEFIRISRQRAKNILKGKDNRKAIILGPCSVHNDQSLMDYAKRWKILSEKVSKNFFCILRFFIEKPRTHLGWKGYVYDPMLDGSNDIALGIAKARKTLLELTKMQIPCSMEFLDPLLSTYFDDLITWGFIGSRTCQSQIHRQLASSFNFPIGFKNPADGDINSAILSAHSANLAHSFLSTDEVGQITCKRSNGNLFTHIVLRGSIKKPNYCPSSVNKAYKLLSKHQILDKLLIDCSHGNKPQKAAFFSVIEQIKKGSDFIAGIMLESFINKGNQDIRNNPLKYGLSVTDECLGWEESEKMILDAKKILF